MIGAAVPAGVVIGVYYFERVEGVRGLRPLFAVCLVAAFWIRSLLAAAAAREMVRVGWEGEAELQPSDAVSILRLSSVVLLGLWCWAWLLVFGSWLGPLGVALLLPFFALRGAVAPGWLARAGCTRDAGFVGFMRAVSDNTGLRATGVLAEGMFIAGLFAMAANLFGVLAFLVLVGRSMLGLDVAMVDAFLSPGNVFVLLGVSCAAMVLLEPLRVASAAVVFLHARVRREGLDLERAVDQALSAGQRRTGSAASRAAAVLLAVSCLTAPASAQLPHELPPEAPMAQAAPDGDPGVRRVMDEILEGPEYREFEDGRGKSLRELVERFFEWLFDLADDQEDPGFGKFEGFGLPMPPGWLFAVFGGGLLLLVAAYLLTTRARELAPVQQVGLETGYGEGDPRERAPAAHLDDAARLAEDQRFRDALRALYLATLVALDRRRLITFDPALTNWQYMRQMTRGEPRSLFGRFTKLFDYKWYGEEPTTRADYERARELADVICRPAGRPDGEAAA
jgi:hypothetical protein